MTRNEAIALVQQGLGFRTDLQEAIILAMQEAQRRLEMGRTKPWFLVEEDAELAITAAVQSYDFPTGGFLGFAEDEEPYYTASGATGKTYLAIRDRVDASKAYNGATTGAPRVLAIRKASFYIEPVPDTSYTVYYSYYKPADVLTADIENVWLANVPELLYNLAGIIVAEDVQDQEAQDKFTTRHLYWSQALVNEIQNRRLSGRPLAMGRNN